jgi:hypothetical protein
MLSGPMFLNQRHAIIVRIGEKRLLRGMLDQIKGLQAELTNGNRLNKRKGRSEGEETPSTKKLKR